MNNILAAAWQQLTVRNVVIASTAVIGASTGGVLAGAAGGLYLAGIAVVGAVGGARLGVFVADLRSAPEETGRVFPEGPVRWILGDDSEDEEQYYV